jgi:hypothetical protein
LLDLFLGKADREIMRGDLEEEFAISILPRYGKRRARFWFWWQAMRTIATRTPSVGGARDWAGALGRMDFARDQRLI